MNNLDVIRQYMASKGALTEDEEMKKAMEQQREAQLASSLAQAGGQIGSAISGQRFDPSAYKPMQEMAQAPVEDLQRQRASQLQRMGAEKTAIELGQLASASDPTSPQSTMIRDYMKKKMNLPVSEGMSLSDVQSQLPIYEKGMAREEAAKNRASQREQRLQDKQEAIDQKKEERTYKRADDYSKQLTSHPTYKDAESALLSYNQIKSAADKKSAYGDISAVYTFMKSLDPNSTVREGEYATAKNAGGIPEKVRNAFNQLKNGQLLTPAQVREMANIAGRMAKSRVDAYNAYKAPIIKRATQHGIEQSDIDPFSDSRTINTIAGSEKQDIPRESDKKINNIEAVGEKNVIKKMHSPSRNQTKIIYADGTEEIKDGH